MLLRTRYLIPGLKTEEMDKFEFRAKNGIVEVGDIIRFDNGFENLVSQEVMDDMNDEMNGYGLLRKVLMLSDFEKQVEIIKKVNDGKD
jgi:hypothetical protein